MWLLQMCGCGHFPGGPGFKTASSARGAGSILSRETNKIPHAIQSGQKKRSKCGCEGSREGVVREDFPVEVMLYLGKQACM